MPQTVTHPPLRKDPTRPPVIDCDIHNSPVSDVHLHEYLSAEWRARRSSGTYLDASFEQTREVLGDRAYIGGEYPRPTPRAARLDSWPPNGQPPASDLPFLQQQLLDQWNVEYGVLTPLLGQGEQLDLEMGAAMATAANRWQIADWLEHEPRLRASVIVPHEDGDLAAAEIHRFGDDPRFVQVLMLIRTAEPMGRRKYWKIYEAAVEHGLPVGVHFGGWGRGPITGVGFPSYYIEDTVGMATAFQDQIASLVFEGVFDRLPELRIVMIEGGFAWLPGLLWRMDRTWRLHRRDLPQVKRPPSEIVREHVWLTTQPMDEPPTRADFDELLLQIGMNDRLMFATDYPHWDFDAPDLALPPRLDPGLRQAIMADNARALYRFDAAR
ncbi:amidohydrolase family protein [Patulibacter defluvii]|uniref:amidohydrolase family protein n=1 Tax=Patulibacter defluvii TaxID=3095358 RepID=UPI002A75BE82|nr:amidohydrolase family protein [Patulibacter sp. DM4]